uniref:Uncharacterized protein n=1 Tax=Sphaeramia orbicularis TaxID=375764 RepID=A0A673CHE9_9TELE
MSQGQILHSLYFVGFKVWVKLQSLPEANPLELGAFFVLLLFVGKFYLISNDIEPFKTWGEPEL